MITNNLSLYAGKIAVDLLRDIVYFPLWWYSHGSLKIFIKLRDFVITKEKSLALWVWIKNIYKPMYGQYDWIGILISFLVRVVQIIFRTIFMIFWVAIALALMLIWVILPVFVVYQIIFQITF